MTARKYNPGFLSDDELIATFCVRTREFASILETLGECDGNSNTHQIVIGPRGSGKTSLLLRVAAEIVRDSGLASRFFPVVFAEESYEVSTAGEFWLECLSRLADRAPQHEDGPDLRRSFEELRTVQDDRLLGDRCLGALQDFADREGKRLVLFVENLNMMFGDMPGDDAGWHLRQTLQTEPRIILLASATSRFDEMDNRDRALYDLFRVLTLRPLDTGACATLWRKVSGQSRAPQTIRALRILTGGSPRLLTIVARFGAKLSFRELMADLLNLVDDHTEYFKSHLDSLPAQERRVYLALAYLWKPATAREIAERARLDTSKCSAHLARLTDHGSVEAIGGTPRRKLYYLTERLYNIYYLMRRARGPAPLIEALIRFMEGYYSADELKEFGARIAREALETDGKDLPHYRTAFEQLVRLPSLAAHRDELLSLTPAAFGFGEGGSGYSAAGAHPTPAKELFENGLALAESGRLQEAVAAWSRLIERFGTSKAPEIAEGIGLALVNKATALVNLGRAEDALAACDQFLERHEESNETAPEEITAVVLFNKGNALSMLSRLEEALAAWGECARRFGQLPAGQEPVASALMNKGIALIQTDRREEALAAWGDIVQRFSASDLPEVSALVIEAVSQMGSLLEHLARHGEALAVWEDVERRFGTREEPEFLELIAGSFVNRGVALAKLDRLEEALAVFDRAVLQFEASDAPEIVHTVAGALHNKGSVLRELDRAEEAVAVWNEVGRRFGVSDVPAILKQVASALLNAGAAFVEMGRPDDAIAIWNDILQRFGANDEPAYPEEVTAALVNKVSVLAFLNRAEEALAVCEEGVRRFEASTSPATLNAFAICFVKKGDLLARMGRTDEAVPVWKEAVRRFGTSEAPSLRHASDKALLGLAGHELRQGSAKAAAEAADRVLQHENGLPDSRWRACFLRARARLEEGDRAACTLDIEAGLGILPGLDILPREALDALSDIALTFGLAETGDLIRESPASDLLLPLTTAFELELGLEPRVAKEVEEVAEDIRRDMREQRRNQRSR